MFDRLTRGLGQRLASVAWENSANRALLPETLLRRLEKRSLTTRRPLGGGLAGEHRGRRLASSVEFADYRSYAPGDDFRRIDWHAYARLKSLLVKIPEAREDVTVHLLLDVSRSMEWGEPRKLEYARKICAGLGYVALSRLDGVRVGALSGSLASRSPAFRGKGQAGQLFQFIQRLPSAGETDLNVSLAAYLAEPQPDGLAVLVSDLLSPAGYEQGLVRLTQAGLQTAVIHVLSRQEQEPSFEGDLELFDVETQRWVELSVGLETLRQYRTELERWQAQVRSHCRARGVRYLPVQTETPIDRTLLGDFRRAGLLE